MRCICLTRAKQLKKFISMADGLYRGDERYVPYMRADLFRTLKKLVLDEKSYTALAVEQNGKYIARVLFTIAPSKQLKTKRCGFFSHFECVNDVAVAELLLGEMCRLMKEAGAEDAEGTYFPYDQDNRRGILVEGFEEEPMMLTSYNPPYYGALLEHCGFEKHFDTVSYRLDYERYDYERIAPLTKRILDRFGLYISHADFGKIDRELEDVHAIICAATTDVIFDEAPSRDDLVRIVKNWRSFLWEDLVAICRRKSDDKPVGVTMSVPNYYTVFRKMKGKSNPVALMKALYYRSRIRSVRAILQYVIPEYQNKGVNFALYHDFYTVCRRRGVTRMEAGTMMENNPEPRRNLEKAGGVLNKTFRIYGRKL